MSLFCLGWQLHFFDGVPFALERPVTEHPCDEVSSCEKVVCGMFCCLLVTFPEAGGPDGFVPKKGLVAWYSETLAFIRFVFGMLPTMRLLLKSSAATGTCIVW